MIYQTQKDWIEAPRKRVSLFGMSGLGKTYLSNLLRDSGGWFHFSVDYRIGTRYMGEHIVDNFKREANRNPFLRNLLMTDSIYIASNISFDNLSPLSTYLGKPGDPDKGGIPFEQYLARQRQHRTAEIAATIDCGRFIEKARHIYGYDHFICDTSGSICEVVSPDNPDDPVLRALSANTLPIWLRGSDDHTEELVRRFDRAPKPMYYHEDFLRPKWQAYCLERDVLEDQVDPDDFIRWSFREAMAHRLPLYRAMAANWGVSVDAEDVTGVRDRADFEAMIAEALAERET